MAELSYLVMTAADCAVYNPDHPHGIVSLNQLLEERSKHDGDKLCVGFTEKQGDSLSCSTLTFAQLHDKVCRLAWLYNTHDGFSIPVRRSSADSTPSIALLAPSCEDFLVTFFALVRLGYRVLLVAPQNTPEDVARLCEAALVDRLLFHSSMSQSAEKASLASKGALRVTQIPPVNQYGSEGSAEDFERSHSPLSPEEESETECIVFHSSGSSGTPKPIPQKHRIWTKSACCKPHSAGFTTTPLFHGGISDLLRAMMSKSALFMFPSTFPITSQNLLEAFDACPDTPTSFLSVPYILEMLGSTEAGLSKLASFELVSTGGSPLPVHIGDSLCKNGVQLVSRYGSSEVGFLMTSFRDFTHDKNWSYLRPAAGKGWLRFEDQGDGTFELVVPPDWPTRNKSNRPDESYATSDLFSKHPDVDDAWLLSGRSDDVILMSNGEKASPAPLEAILRKSEFVKDALVFGSNKPSLGAALIPFEDTIAPEKLRIILQDVNAAAPSHAQLVPELVVILSNDAAFPKASKGTLQRGRAYEAFAEVIEKAYLSYEEAPTESGVGPKLKVEGEILDYVLQTVCDALQMGRVDPNDDLFNLGLGSLQAVRVRNLLSSNVDLAGAKLPPNIVYECSTPKRLAKYLSQLGDASIPGQIDNDLELIRELRQGPLCQFVKPTANSARQPGQDWIVTGATGSLGAQIIPQVLQRNPNATIHCLVRATDDQAAKERIFHALRNVDVAFTDGRDSQLICYAAQFSKPKCGLSDKAYESLQANCGNIVHAAWPVHFGAGLNSFIPQLHGVRNLINLAQEGGGRFFFCSSTAACLGQDQHVPERISTDAKDAAAMGYARSKHVAESICAAAWSNGMQGQIGVLRLGQLSGDTVHGHWKAEEGWPQLFASGKLTGKLPDLQKNLNWLPVDKAAEAICDIAFDAQALQGRASTPVFNIVSIYHSTTYAQAVKIAQQAGLQVGVVQAKVWLAQLQELEQSGKEHSCLKMLPTWLNNYGESRSADKCPEPTFETSSSEQYTQAMAEPLTDELLLRYFRYWAQEGLL